MIILDFGAFPVDMLDEAALHEALLGDFDNGYVLDDVASTGGALHYTTGASDARIRMFGAFHEPPQADDLISVIEIYSDADMDGGGFDGPARLKVIAEPANNIISFDRAFQDFIVGGDITALFVPGQALEIQGSGFNDQLLASHQADRLLGFGGDDTLRGGFGNDTMNGGAGNDVYFVNAAGDRVIEAAAGGTDTVQSSATTTLAAGVEKLVLLGAGAINGTGNALANTLTGNAGNNTLNGGTGPDVLSGRGGNDTLIWALPDRFDGGTGNGDTLRVVGDNVNINLQSFPDVKFRNIEIVDLTGINNGLTVNLQDVLSSSNDTLRVMGNADDSFQRGSGWTQVADQMIGGQIYNRYTQGLATLLVDADISQGT
jgi:hypothetical protein